MCNKMSDWQSLLGKSASFHCHTTSTTIHDCSGWWVPTASLHTGISFAHRKSNKGGTAKVSNMGDFSKSIRTCTCLYTKEQVLDSCVTLHTISTVYSCECRLTSSGMLLMKSVLMGMIPSRGSRNPITRTKKVWGRYGVCDELMVQSLFPELKVGLNLLRRASWYIQSESYIWHVLEVRAHNARKFTYNGQHTGRR